MMAVLQTEALCKRFRQVPVLDGVDLTVEEGTVYGLVGPNGAGKTTTLKILMNILEATSGRALVLDSDSRELGPRHFRQIGYVSESQDLPEWMTVRELMAYLKPFYPAWDDERARELVRGFELPLDRPLKHLSHGMRMKASLASSLAYRPRLLVLDEPFSGLDPLVREEFVEGLIDTAQETTMLISSHDLGEIEHFATHIGYLDNGRLQFSQSLASLSGRFREVEITLPDARPLPAEWPSYWLHPETSPTMIRFVDSEFDDERTVAQARRLFGAAAIVTAHAMRLRSIFVALARQSRKTAA